MVRLKQAGDDAAAAERAAIGAACARLTLGEDSSVYRKLAGLATTAPPSAAPSQTEQLASSSEVRVGVLEWVPVP